MGKPNLGAKLGLARFEAGLMASAAIALLLFLSQQRDAWTSLWHWQQLGAWAQAVHQWLSHLFSSPLAYSPLWAAGGVVFGLLLLKQWFPQPNPLLRSLISVAICLLTLRYGLWRGLTTLNFDDPLNFGVGLVLLLAEGVGLVSVLCTTVLAMFRSDRSAEATQLAQAVKAGTYLPSVDVIIPTYNEPAEILRRTVVVAQAMQYPNMRVYLLDDQRRPEIRALAAELGCGYRDRPNNDHAKAGNINHALPNLGGELVAVFDADYVPSRNFLERTVGFFQSERVAMVQTPQNFFNEDPVTLNLGLQGVVNNEQNYFFRYLQPSRDAFNAVVCCGSCFVIRRSALDEIGGIPTESIAEDMFTSIRLQALGYQIKYLNEPLSAGMSAEDTNAYTNQRLRWGRGTLQLLFCRPNPLTIAGLTWQQRLYHGLSVLYWINAVPRLLFLLLPVLCLGFGLVPIQATISELLYFFLPLYLANLLSFSWLTGGWRSLFWSEVYEVMICVPMAMMVIQALFRPFGQGFKVTPKGLDSGPSIRPNWTLMVPLLTIASFILLSGARYFGLTAWEGFDRDTLLINSVWNGYNLLLIGVAILAAIDIPQRRYPRFDQQLLCELQLDPQLEPLPLSGRTLELSEAGAQVQLHGLPTEFLARTPTGQLRLVGLDGSRVMSWPVTVRWSQAQGEGWAIAGLQFGSLPPSDYRQLIDQLFCQPGQWRDVRVPEYRTFWAFWTTLLRLHPLADSRG